MQQKIIWTILLGIGILSSFVSCKRVDERYFDSFHYRNQSGYSLIITSYYKIDNIYKFNRTDSIPNGQFIQQEYERMDPSTYAITTADSVILKFNSDSSRYSAFILDTLNNKFNILNTNNYKLEATEVNKRKFSYVFTLEDYNYAK